MASKDFNPLSFDLRIWKNGDVEFATTILCGASKQESLQSFNLFSDYKNKNK